jgi:hypothetical protein
MSVKSSSFDDISFNTTVNEDDNNNDKYLEEKKVTSNDPDSLDPRIQVRL